MMDMAISSALPRPLRLKRMHAGVLLAPLAFRELMTLFIIVWTASALLRLGLPARAGSVASVHTPGGQQPGSLRVAK